MNYEIKLPLFEGPFDLLLFFIERDELDIYDIPIFKLTTDFLTYIQQMEELNMEVASEFILVAATLMSIKAKMLLPRPQIDSLGNQIDPRDELIKHLLEYKRYKSVIAELGSLEQNRLSKEKRGNVIEELKQLSEINNVESEMQDLDLYKLLKVFEKVSKRYEQEVQKPIHKVVQYPYSLDEQKIKIIALVELQKRVAFTELLAESSEKIYLIFNFLAILELLQLRKITINIGEGFNNFWIEPLHEEDIHDINEYE